MSTSLSYPHRWDSSVVCSSLAAPAIQPKPIHLPSSLRLLGLPRSLRSLTSSPTMIAPPHPDHQQPIPPTNNPVALPCSITRTHSDPPSPPHPLAQEETNLQEDQEHLGDVVILGKLHLVPPNLPLLIGGGVWKIPCTLLGMLWMVGMLELTGILRGWLRSFRVRRGQSLALVWPSQERSGATD